MLPPVDESVVDVGEYSGFPETRRGFQLPALHHCGVADRVPAGVAAILAALPVGFGAEIVGFQVDGFAAGFAGFGLFHFTTSLA
jgi:hypothetical protein